MNPFELAKAEHLAGQVKEAANSYRRILEGDPDNAAVINMLGNALLDLGEHDAALAEYERALEAEPDYEAAHYNRGNVLCLLRRLDEAVEAYRRAIELKPDYVAAHFNLGNVHLDLGRPREAIEEYETALKLSPEDESIHFNLGKALAALQRHDEALEAYARAVEHNPDYLRAHSEMGHTQLQMGRADRALPHFRKAIELDPERASEHFYFGMSLMVLGRLEESEAALRRAMQLEPDNGRSYECLGRVLMEQGRREEALAIARKWLAIEPDNSRALHLMAAWSGESPPMKASEAYVRAEFDRLASDFESTVARLKYLAPILIAEALRKAGVPSDKSAIIADVGCGTGLISPLLRPLAKELVGVDLSEVMLEYAALRESYDELVNADLEEYLRGQPGRFDIIVSADTFVYFGALEGVSDAAAHALRPWGKLVFTTELLDDAEPPEGFQLNVTGRYSHTEEYVRRSLADAGLDVSQCRRAFLRMEGHAAVNGLVVVAQKRDSGNE